MAHEPAQIPDDERADERVPAVLHARLSGGGFERDACILDLSPVGLLLTAAVPPKPSHKVNVRSNGYSMTGEVIWVEERRFGVSLQAPIIINDVIEAKILKPGIKLATTTLPENFGIRPEAETATTALLNLFESKWVCFGAIAAIGLTIAVSVGNFVGESAGGMADSMANLEAASQAEGNATQQQ